MALVLALVRRSAARDLPTLTWSLVNWPSESRRTKREPPALLGVVSIRSRLPTAFPAAPRDPVLAEVVLADFAPVDLADMDLDAEALPAVDFTDDDLAEVADFTEATFVDFAATGGRMGASLPADVVGERFAAATVVEPVPRVVLVILEMSGTRETTAANRLGSAIRVVPFRPGDAAAYPVSPWIRAGRDILTPQQV